MKYTKKLVSFCAIISLVLAMNVFVSADVVQSKSRLIVNGVTTELPEDSALISVDGSLLVPLRALTEIIDSELEIEWNQDERMVTIVKQYKEQPVEAEADEPSAEEETAEETEAVEAEGTEAEATENEAVEAEVTEAEATEAEPEEEATEADEEENESTEADETAEIPEEHTSVANEESAALTKTVKLWISQNEIEINGEKSTFTGATPLIYNGKTYMPLRLIAQVFDMEVFWEPETKTAIITDPERLEIIRSLNEDQNDIKKFEMEMEAETIMTAPAYGVSINMAMTAKIQSDLDNNFYWIQAETESEGVTAAVEMYDNGENTYIKIDADSTGTWQKYPISIYGSALEFMNGMDTSVISNLNDISYAGMLLTEDASGNYILEGDIYVKEIFEKMNLNELMASVTAAMGGSEEDAPKMDMPASIYTKMVIDKNTHMPVSMEMEFAITITAPIDGVQEEEFKYYYNVNYVKYDANAEFEPVVPQDIIDSAVPLE